MSTTEFRTHIRTAIADAQLQKALDDNARRRASGRMAAFASLPDLPTSRRAAHAVRADTIDRLEELLAQFSSAAEAHGMYVHRAADAAEARRLVIEIAEATAPHKSGAAQRPLLFAKSKSMVSEEIELNAALEERGHRVVETDLGEYIVQLRGEKPAHIITPAVHLQRHQVGALFEAKLGLPYTEDIPALTAAARAALRRVFLDADVGISGVNFAVAETGGLCIVTNEGNGRMVTTLPRVHIALLGMERLVPTLQDLTLMLSLLPRSATGQKLSVYTQLIHSPRLEGEADGALERHVIIIDNGRSRLRESDLREALYCIRCGACLNACPVFREIGGHAYVGRSGAAAPYPGPIGSVISPALAGLHEFGQLAQASSLCGACKDACPVEIDLPTMLTRVRAGSPEVRQIENGVALSSGTRAALRAYALVAGSATLLGIMQRLAGLGARLLSPRHEWMRLPAWTRWGASKDIRRPAIKPFRDRWSALVSAGNTPGEAGPPILRAASAQPDEDDRAENRAETAAATAEAMLDRFVSELQAVGARGIRIAQREVAKRIIDELQGHGIRRLVCWDSIAGLAVDELTAAGIGVQTQPDPEIRAGITGCTCAIAETGTLLLAGEAGRPLTASLLPEIHMAVVAKEQLVWSLEEALRSPHVRRAAATVLITGPSRTADIEMTLTVGVHGPRELLVLITE